MEEIIKVSFEEWINMYRTSKNKITNEKKKYKRNRNSKDSWKEINLDQIKKIDWKNYRRFCIKINC